MKLESAINLIQSSFSEAFLNSVCIKRKIPLFLIISFILYLFSIYSQLKAIDFLKRAMEHRKSETFLVYLNSYLLFTLLRLISKVSHHIIYTIFIEKYGEIIKLKLLRNEMDKSYDEFSKSNTGEIIKDLNVKKDTYCRVIELVLFKALGLGFFAIYVVIKVSSSTNFIFIFLMGLYLSLYCKNLISSARKIMEYNSRLIKEKKVNTDILLDKIENVELIKNFNLEDREAEDYYQKLNKEKNLELGLSVYSEKSKLIGNFILEIPFVSLLILNCNGLNSHITDIITIIMIFKDLNGVLKEISDLVSMFVQGLVFLEEQPNPVQPKRHCDLIFNEKINFENVNIYQNNEVFLKNISCEIKKGEKIGIVGRNGTGKSTLVKSLIRFKNFDGNIKIDDQIINDVTYNSIFKIISYIPQDEFMLNTTVIDNIRLGRKDATRDEIEKLIQTFGMKKDFKKLAEGIDTKVCNEGSNLSSGLRQKISILRSFIRNTPIIILDEATSSLDNKFEANFLKKVVADPKKTIIAIIHQKNLLGVFDKIIFLDSGEIDDFGSYSELLSRSTKFKNFVS